MVQPAWKAETGIAQGGPNLQGLSEPVSSKPADAPWDDSGIVDSWEDAADLEPSQNGQSYAAGPAQSEEAKAAETNIKMRVCRDFMATQRPMAFSALTGTEVVARQDFDGLGPGEWISCRVNEVMLMIFAADDLVFVATHTRKECASGWIPAKFVKQAGYHEFLVRLQASSAPPKKRLGLVWASASGQLPGLVVVDVKPDSLLDDWNKTCRDTFPRDQVLPGDFITWAQGCRDTEGMRQVVRSFPGYSTLVDGGIDQAGQAAEPRLRLRISRMGTFLDTAGSLARPSEDSLAQLLEYRNQAVQPRQAPPSHNSVGGTIGGAGSSSWAQPSYPGQMQGQPRPVPPAPGPERFSAKEPDPWSLQAPWAAAAGKSGKAAGKGPPIFAAPPPVTLPSVGAAPWIAASEIASTIGEPADEWTTPMEGPPDAAASEISVGHASHGSHASAPIPPLPPSAETRPEVSGDGGAARRLMQNSGIIPR